MSVSILSGDIRSRAKKNKLCLEYKKPTLQAGQKKRLKIKGASRKEKGSSSNKTGKAVITVKASTWKRKGNITVKGKKAKETVQPVSEDLARALNFIHQHKEELE